LGEAYGLRAYLQLDLFRLFGDLNDTQKIPYNQSSKVISHDGVDAATYWKLLQGDLEKSRELLANDPIRTAGKILEIQGNSDIDKVNSNDKFYQYSRNCRMNYYAASAVEARALLYFGHLQEAADMAQTVLKNAFGDTSASGKPFYWVDKNAIQSSYNYIFYPEVLFGVNSLNMYTNWTNLTSGTELGKVYAVSFENLQGNIFRNDIANGAMSTWEDIRSQQWGISRLGGNQYISNKYTQYVRTEQFMPINNTQPLIRTGELFFIIAENEIENGTLSDAITYLNEFRFHRGSQYSSLPDPEKINNKESAEDILETEYYKEFYGEGQAFFFMKRKGRNEIINPSAIGKETVDLKSYIVPIPGEETEY
jgi:hypothetical protein